MSTPTAENLALVEEIKAICQDLKNSGWDLSGIRLVCEDGRGKWIREDPRDVSKGD